LSGVAVVEVKQVRRQIMPPAQFTSAQKFLCTNYSSIDRADPLFSAPLALVAFIR
jgi:hypothetical protein